MEQSCEECIADPDEGADDRDSDADNDRIVDEFAFRRPRDFLHLGHDFAQELHRVRARLALLCQMLHTLSLAAATKSGLLRFLMDRMLLAELAVLVHLKTIRVVLLVLVRAVVAAMALRALERDVVAHVFPPLALQIMTVFKMSPIQFSTPFPACQ